MAHTGSLTGVPAQAIFGALIQRERLGSATIGGGMTIPHAVFAGLTQSVVIITTLERAVAFDAHDNKPIDIICTILGSDRADCDHLKLASMTAKHLADGTICEAMRGAKTASVIRHCFDLYHASAA